MCLSMYKHEPTCHVTHVEVRAHLAVFSLLPSWVSGIELWLSGSTTSTFTGEPSFQAQYLSLRQDLTV